MRWLLAVMVVGCAGDEQPQTVECGSGTALVDGMCEVTTLTCGAGTQDVDGECVPGMQFALRAPAMVKADGYSPTEVVILATRPNGEPATEHVVITTSRAGSGEFASPFLFLDSLGGATNFIPCNSEVAGCVGPTTFNLALASAPTVPVASIDVNLVAPSLVGSMQQCMGPDDTFYVFGTNYYINGPATAPAGTWDVFGDVNRGVVHLVPNDLSSSWQIQFNTTRLHMPMIPSVYDNIALASGGPEGTAGMDISIPNATVSSCDPHGAFQIHEFSVDTSNPQYIPVTRLAASFVLTCPLDPTRTLSGCVSYTR